jgi:surface protein
MKEAAFKALLALRLPQRHRRRGAAHMERGYMHYKRGNERKAIAHFGRAMEYGAMSLLDLPQELLDKILLEAMRSAMSVARVNRQTARAARAIVKREKSVFVQHHRNIDLACARALATKPTLEWLDFCAVAAGADGTDPALEALHERAVREFNNWYDMVGRRFHDLVDIANSTQSTGATAAAARGLLAKLVADVNDTWPAEDKAALSAVVNGTQRYEPVTDVRKSIGKAMYGPEFLWDTRKLTSLRVAFENQGPFEIRAWLWDTSKVEDMAGAFYNFKGTLHGIETWDVSRVKSMSRAFAQCEEFNKDIGYWNTSNVTDMAHMFHDASAFNGPIGHWNTSKVEDMRCMFDEARAFNQPIGNWNTSTVVNMSNMFHGALAFNQPIGNWDTSNVVNMSNMFHGSLAFNWPIGNWDTSKVEDISYMFYEARSFNQPLQKWNTSRVVYMNMVFFSASRFDQDISTWDVSRCRRAVGMFEMSGVVEEQKKPTFAPRAPR